jgi:hypothetical protein
MENHSGNDRSEDDPRGLVDSWKVTEMRKALVVLVSAGLATALVAAPAHAGAKKKKIEDTVSVTAAPFPNYSSHTGTSAPGCTAGEEGVHKQSTALHVPGKGKLTADLTGFQGDWDLYVFDEGGGVLGLSAAEQLPAGAPPEEAVTVAFKKMADITIVACNWAGAPQAELHYKLVYKASKGDHHAHH